jgi:hypothetical protein
MRKLFFAWFCVGLQVESLDLNKISSAANRKIAALAIKLVPPRTARWRHVVV